VSGDGDIEAQGGYMPERGPRKDRRLRRVGFAVAASMAGAVASLSAGAAVAASVPRAEVRGVEDRALRTLIQQAIGDAPARPTSRIEARRRAREAGDKAIAVLRSQGYYDYDVEPDIGDGESPAAFIAVITGPVSKIAQPGIEWVGAAPDAGAVTAATAAMALFPGAPGRAESVIAAEGRIIAVLEKHGYADALARPRQVIVDHADQSVRPTFRIAAGPQVRLDGVKVEGKGRTNPRWVAKLASWRTGQTYHPQAVAELERRLLDTGVYDSVTVALAPPNQAVNGERPVIVSLADRPKGTIELGLSYSTTEGAGVDSHWILYNRLGGADTLTNTLRIANIDSRLQAQLSLPDWRKPEETLKLTAALYRDRTPAYDDIGAGVSADLTHRYGKTSFFTYGASLDQTDTTEIEQINFVLGNKKRRLTTVGLLGAFSLDRSNDPLDPIRGWKLEARAEPKFATGNGSIAYFKLSAQGSVYLPLDANGDTVVAARLKLGGIAGGDIPGVPAQDRFFSGGGGSVRGYGYQMVGPRYPDNTPEGGLSLFETSAEIRRKLTGAWSVAAFIDAGTVGQHVYPDFREPSVGVGVGVRYNLGFGPIRVDLATPLNPRHGDSAVQLYLSIGQSF
jgi:translocation and assembly module TamA